MKLHVIGFEDWWNRVPNPARLLIEGVNQNARMKEGLPCEIQTHLLPVPMPQGAPPHDLEGLQGQFRPALEEVLSKIQPGELGLGFGQGALDFRNPHLERSFVSYFATTGDLKLNLPDEKEILTVDPATAERICAEVNSGMAKGKPKTERRLEATETAGAFYCNQLGRALAKRGYFFVHLPTTSSQEEADKVQQAFSAARRPPFVGFATPQENLKLFRHLAIAITRPLC